MAMVYNPIFINHVPSPKKLTYFPPNSHSIQFHNNNLYPQKRKFPLPKVASIPFPPINVDYLETEFSGHGVSFSTIGESCVVTMRLDNGSLATLMLPSGLVTSYKAPMWHGGLLELLHTAVSEAEDGGGAVVQGGVSLALKFEGGDDDDDDENGGFLWAPNNWALSNVRGNPQESIQVELISSNFDRKVKVKHIVSLQQDTISSEVLITNMRPSSLHLMGSIVAHLSVSTPEATYAVGLENSNYFKKPPFLSNFCIVPSDFDKKDSKKSWGSMSFMELFSSWSSRNPNNGGNEEGEEMEGEEDDNYKHLTEKFSMIYTSAPRNFTIIDRGKRNSVVVGREGFNELYMMSPGSSHKAYGKYSYICIGQAALLEPLTLGPGAQWRGVQHLHNPNL